jgi:hypothetical protein
MAFINFPAIVQQLLGGDGAKNFFANLAKKKLRDQTGRTAAKTLARSVYKGIDTIADPKAFPDVPLEARLQLSLAATENIASEFEEIGPIVRQYGAAVANLERNRGGAGEEAARAHREQVEDRLESALVDIGRVLSGKEAQDR